MTADDRTVFQAPDPTILIPRPGGLAPQAPKQAKQPAPPRAAKTSAGVELQRLIAGVNPLLGAANVLLALVAQLRATSSHADPAALHGQLLEHIAEFESLARANGVPKTQVSAARYVLCSFIDEVIAATPWGSDGTWLQRNLLQEFHDERSGGEKAFKLLERLGEDVATNADLLELFYVCLALGFEGRYRGVAGGRAQLDAIAQRVFEVVHPPSGQAPARTLSLRWQGVATRSRRDLSFLPLWAVFALGGVLLLGVFLLLNAWLDDLARPVFRQIHAAATALSVDRSAPAAKARVAPLLRADIANGAIEVRDETQRSVVTLPADALFVTGSARVDPRQADLLARIAQALKGLPGQVVVIGHTDSVPVSSLQFPSNWHLSREQAQAVMAALAQAGERVERLRAEGRADVEPRASGAAAADRARNRRIDVELLLPRPDG